MINYEFRSIVEFSEKIRTIGYTQELGFTLDTPDDVYGANWEPMGWYGIRISEAFDAYTVIIGNYGVGIVYINTTMDTGMTIEDVIINFIKEEQGIVVNKNYKIAVDMDDWSERIHSCK